MRCRYLLVALVAAVAIPAAAWADDGAKIYETKCASCHGKDARGNPEKLKTLKVELPALDLFDHDSLARSQDEWIKVTQDGQKKMPKYKEKLSAEQIAAVVAYLRGLAPKAP